MDLDTYEAVCKERFQSQNEQLKRIEEIAVDNAKILNNGLKDRMKAVEAVVKELDAKIDRYLRPQPWWQKLLLKWGGTVVILLSFILLSALALKLLPMEYVNRIITIGEQVVQ